MASSQVAIIGAGPAGIAAATRLMMNGIRNIVLLEAERRIGGRIHTQTFGDGVVDLGAQFCHGEKGNVVFDMAHPLNLLDSSMMLYTNMAFADSTGKILDKDTGSWLLGLCLDITDRAGKQYARYGHSLGDYVISEFESLVHKDSNVDITSSQASEFLQWFHRFQNSIDGSDSWFDTSLVCHSEYQECEGDPVLIWKEGGFSRVLDLLMKKYPNPNLAIPVETKIQFGKEVTQIVWNKVGTDGTVIIRCKDGSQILTERVIVTVSLGVLKEQSSSLFIPALPAIKTNAISGLSIGTVNKIFLKFSHCWWPEQVGGFSFLWTEEDSRKFAVECEVNSNKTWLRDVFGFYTDKRQPRVLCGWLVGSAARTMELSSDEEVINGCQELLQRFLGQTYKIPKIQSMVRSSWHSNPHFRGSYSFQSMESERSGAKARHLAEPLISTLGKKVVLFAGEATHDHFYSTVHGAIETGWREADRIIQDIGLRRSSL